jgi:hypothetical protein
VQSARAILIPEKMSRSSSSKSAKSSSKSGKSKSVKSTSSKAMVLDDDNAGDFDMHEDRPILKTIRDGWEVLTPKVCHLFVDFGFLVIHK